MKVLIISILISLIIVSCGFNFKSDPNDRYWFRFVLDMYVGEDLIITKRVFDPAWTAYQMMEWGVWVTIDGEEKFIHKGKYESISIFYSDKRPMPGRFANLQTMW